MIKKNKGPAFWVTSKMPFFVLFGILYMGILWMLYQYMPSYRKSNDLWNDRTFSIPLEGEVFPDNIILIDIDSWPYYKDNREEAQTARNETVTRITGIIELLNKHRQVKPPFIWIDMTFESIAEDYPMKRLLEQVRQQDNIFLSLEFDREKKSLKFPDNFFWDKIKENIDGIKNRLLVVSLEKYKGEPVRRYQTYYKAGFEFGSGRKEFNFPSAGTMAAKMLNRYYLEDSKQFEVPQRTSRFRYRYLIKDVKEDFKKYRVYSFGQVNDWLAKPGGKIDLSKSMVIFARIDPDPGGRDLLPVCAEIKEKDRNNRMKYVPATLPGALVHINAAMSILMKEHIGKMGNGWILAIFFLLSVVLILVYNAVDWAFSRWISRWIPWPGQWHTKIFLFITIVLSLLVMEYLLKLFHNQSVEIPMYTFYMSAVNFVPVLVGVDLVYRHILLIGLFRCRYRKLMKTFKLPLVQCVVNNNPMLRVKRVVDLFETIMAHLAFYELAEWRTFPGRKKIKLKNIRKTSIENHRDLIKDIDLKVNSLFKANSLDTAEESPYNLLLKTRNDFSGPNSSALNKWQWEQTFNKIFPVLLSFLGSLKEELEKKIKTGKGDAGNTGIYLHGSVKKLPLFPLSQVLGCAYHREQEMFIYTPGLCLRKGIIAMRGKTPFCKPLLKGPDQETARESFKNLEEELKHAED